MKSSGWSVFTKPWKDLTVPRLGRLATSMGFDGVELPVRPGFQVTPDRIGADLPEAARVLGEEGVTVSSIASSPDEAVFAACAEARVPIIRIMLPRSPLGPVDAEARARELLDVLAVRAETFGVRVGVQPHYDDLVSDSSELAALLRDYDSRHVGAIWDSAHDALARKWPEDGLDRLAPWLAMANFKNAYYRRVDDGPSDLDPRWEPVFTDARSGMAPWRRAVDHLVSASFAGTVCLTAEYSDESDLEAKVSADLAYAKQLWNTAESRSAGAQLA